MDSQDQSNPDVLAALHTLTEELRSFRQYTEDAWKAGHALSSERRKEYEARRAESQRHYDARERAHDEQQRVYEERQRVYDERVRRHDRTWKLGWILNVWFLFVSIIFVLWLAQQPSALMG